MTLVEREVAYIKKDEGFSGTPYYDTKNVLSIGWGHNLQDEPLPAMFQEFLDRHGYITEAMAEALLAKDLRDAEADCCKLFSNWPRIPVEIQGPLLNMAFNMGYDRFHSFEKLDASRYECDIKDLKDTIEKMDAKLDRALFHQNGKRDRQ